MIGGGKWVEDTAGERLNDVPYAGQRGRGI